MRGVAGEARNTAGTVQLVPGSDFETQTVSRSSA